MNKEYFKNKMITSKSNNLNESELSMSSVKKIIVSLGDFNENEKNNKSVLIDDFYTIRNYVINNLELRSTYSNMIANCILRVPSRAFLFTSLLKLIFYKDPAFVKVTILNTVNSFKSSNIMNDYSERNVSAIKNMLFFLASCCVYKMIEFSVVDLMLTFLLNQKKEDFYIIINLMFIEYYPLLCFDDSVKNRLISIISDINEFFKGNVDRRTICKYRTIYKSEENFNTGTFGIQLMDVTQIEISKWDALSESMDTIVDKVKYEFKKPHFIRTSFMFFVIKSLIYYSEKEDLNEENLNEVLNILELLGINMSKKSNISLSEVISLDIHSEIKEIFLELKTVQFNKNIGTMLPYHQLFKIKESDYLTDKITENMFYTNFSFDELSTLNELEKMVCFYELIMTIDCVVYKNPIHIICQFIQILVFRFSLSEDVYRNILVECLIVFILKSTHLNVGTYLIEANMVKGYLISDKVLSALQDHMGLFRPSLVLIKKIIEGIDEIDYIPQKEFLRFVGLFISRNINQTRDIEEHILNKTNFDNNNDIMKIIVGYMNEILSNEKLNENLSDNFQFIAQDETCMNFNEIPRIKSADMYLNTAVGLVKADILSKKDFLNWNEKLPFNDEQFVKQVFMLLITIKSKTLTHLRECLNHNKLFFDTFLVGNKKRIEDFIKILFYTWSNSIAHMKVIIDFTTINSLIDYEDLIRLMISQYKELDFCHLFSLLELLDYVLNQSYSLIGYCSTKIYQENQELNLLKTNEGSIDLLSLKEDEKKDNINKDIDSAIIDKKEIIEKLEGLVIQRKRNFDTVLNIVCFQLVDLICYFIKKRNTNVDLVFNYFVNLVVGNYKKLKNQIYELRAIVDKLESDEKSELLEEFLYDITKLL